LYKKQYIIKVAVTFLVNVYGLKRQKGKNDRRRKAMKVTQYFTSKEAEFL